MGIIGLFVVGCLAGYMLFRKNKVLVSDEPCLNKARLSVIIPARNEQHNLPNLLHSLQAQTIQPYEIIVVDDCSDDQTKEIAESYGVKVIANPSLPQGWTGKNWAVWNGYLQASGELLAFLDADIRLAPRALESLIKARDGASGVISVVPFHHTEKWFERLALIFNFLGVFTFMSPFEKKNPKKGLYGSCILTTRKDYEKITGHESIKSEVLDDLSLGAKYMEAGIQVTNFIGYDLVSFRMYPQGIKSEIQGFGKGAVLSTSTLNVYTIILIAIWVAGLIVAESALFFINTSWFIPLIIGYLLYTLQCLYFVKYIGIFGIFMPIFHILSTLFFIFVMFYSVYQVVFLGHVSWKGRHIKVRGRRDL
ncbi:glycosyltransferase family 2 protein [Paenibacillus sp. SYP-B3998]|uniref:4,4'-diaponeurosporenoate glycosyltransferase n=1 Tax=Paenibacillus sp. SYP-B3998 TaxID=2678564 RepID=A0A6G3ZTL2_9BACL|nr:glycosyltransferase family 2 protein [Paenibacillus sp. SYP-B3998]NEW04757.1 glycosyltransferase family 2 protein [Paenibacillus sp. SYP-B3998]